MELKNKNIINKMTLKEKALLLSGKGMWKTYDFEAYGIPAFFLSDGPHGMRTQEGQGDCWELIKVKLQLVFQQLQQLQIAGIQSWLRKLRQHWERKQSLLE